MRMTFILCLVFPASAFAGIPLETVKVNVDKVLEESNASIALSEQAHQQADKDIKENRFRRQAMIVAVLMIGLLVVVLVMLRRQLSPE